jgi:hypothetical protein
LELSERCPANHSITTSLLREYIRQQLAMPTLEGQAHLGDMRATGDALGGHGLKIKPRKKTVKGKTDKLVDFNAETLAKCKDWLAQHETEDDSILHSLDQILDAALEVVDEMIGDDD